MLCGVAKDLTKLGGKTVTKLVTPEEKQVRMINQSINQSIDRSIDQFASHSSSKHVP